MRNVLLARVVLLCLILMLTLSLTPIAAKQKGKPANALLTGGEFTKLAGSCSIDCGDGKIRTTDADTVIECACDCSSVCHDECEATDGSTTRTCDVS
jgi:hypothetical protein